MQVASVQHEYGRLTLAAVGFLLLEAVIQNS